MAPSTALERRGSILITGANGGLGSAFVANFTKSPLGKQYRGLYTVRNPSSATELGKVLGSAPAETTSEVFSLDLGSLESVRSLAADINARVSDGTLEPIRAVILNAGFQNAGDDALEPTSFTVEGYEMAFGANYLANFVLVLDILQSMDKEHGRIVFVSSWTHDADDPRNNSPSAIYPEEFKTMFTSTDALAKGITYTDAGWNAGMRRYGVSKLLGVMWMYELQRRLNLDPALSNISVLSLDPAAMGGTGITKRSGALIRFITAYVLVFLQTILVYIMPNGSYRPPWKSAQDLMLACFDEEHLGSHPKAVYLNGSVKGVSSIESRDEAKQKQLWEDSLKLAMIRDGETALQNWQ
ncbi:short chain dehydrogenase/reductase SDR [Drepanopeziza brunnea f. sp. 'multigermtubi' MB_m1]|uniref:3beta-hydroxysteroid 3-dehydrogenase n=1 Tax=Marssonina brunnea f. sp. multigermtubi (strain MB_m1) TaxID=1072389 RepID=K1W6N9_MARBU|nr:short chain dehydrogenase/reductase SDR [Drepanopeziza brunnea f. sp. 'multigermtubi' MB_m1]EKD12635.1 short chain dehydrogenase/reductase SDR [Drepanopeziza brunnea f. sp. 'multigermtubi' MB_m1]